MLSLGRRSLGGLEEKWMHVLMMMKIETSRNWFRLVKLPVYA
jgi:hypothetical protein